MALLQWDDSYSVSVVEIDNQHKKLVAIINELHDSMMKGSVKGVLDSTLKELIGYAGTHFKTEEKYFDEYGYAEAAAHKKEHSDFTRKVAGFKKEFEGGRMGLSIEVMSFLSDWLKNHIKTVDKKYSRFFNEKGLR